MAPNRKYELPVPGELYGPRQVMCVRESAKSEHLGRLWVFKCVVCGDDTRPKSPAKAQCELGRCSKCKNPGRLKAGKPSQPSETICSNAWCLRRGLPQCTVKCFYAGHRKCKLCYKFANWCAAAKGKCALTVAYLLTLYRDTCPVFGTALDWDAAAEGHRTDDTPELDKIIPSLGYVPGNVCIVSSRANRMKNDHTQETLLKVLRYVRLYS